jgi:hypothetical protein
MLNHLWKITHLALTTGMLKALSDQQQVEIGSLVVLRAAPC